MNQEQIEAVRMNLRMSFEAWAEPLDKLAGCEYWQNIPTRSAKP